MDLLLPLWLDLEPDLALHYFTASNGHRMIATIVGSRIWFLCLWVI